jgi:2-oxoglutarate ferredoxin oxidoreductase subunit beta
MAAENKLDYVEPKDEITISYDEGTTAAVTLHDGSRLVLNKLDGGHDFRDPDEAIMTIRRSASKGEVATGLLYVNEAATDLHDALDTPDRPLNEIPVKELCPGARALEGVNARFR